MGPLARPRPRRMTARRRALRLAGRITVGPSLIRLTSATSASPTSRSRSSTSSRTRSRSSRSGTTCSRICPRISRSSGRGSSTSTSASTSSLPSRRWYAARVGLPVRREADGDIDLQLCEMPSIEILDISRNKIRKLPPNPGTLVNLKVRRIRPLVMLELALTPSRRSSPSPRTASSACRRGSRR